METRNEPGSAGEAALSTTDEKESGRVEAFSDGVFAIAITLLVLELKVPHAGGAGGLAAALADQWPSYAALLISFATIGIMWLNHHRLFTLIRRVDTPVLLLNLWLLLGVAIVPFPTALIAGYLGHDGERLAAVVYAGNGLNIALAFWGLWMYSSSRARRPSLLRLPADHPQVRAIRAQYRFGPLFYVAAVALAVVNATAAMVLCGALALFFALPPGAERRH
jgi:uncharacterized membrane protein